MQPDQNAPIEPMAPQTVMPPAAAPVKSNKNPIIFIGGIIAALLLTLGIGWIVAAQEAGNYSGALGKYKQNIKDARDATDKELSDKGVVLADPEAPGILEKGAKNLDVIIASAPKQPAIFGLINITPPAAKQEADNLTSVAKNYSAAMHDVNDLYVHYQAIVAILKPINSLPKITETNQKNLADAWAAALVKIKTLKAPKTIEADHAAFVQKFEEINSKIQDMYAAYQKGQTTKFADLLAEVEQGIKDTNRLFGAPINAKSKELNAAVTSRYAELDKLIR